MEKDGRLVEMGTYDTTYRFVKVNLRNPAAMPRITDFILWKEQEECTFEVLQGNQLLLLVQSTAEVDTAMLGTLQAHSHHTDSTIQLRLITTVHNTDLQSIAATIQAPLYFADASLLKKMLRTDVGFMLLKEGTIVGKWPYEDMPGHAVLLKKLAL